MNFSCTMFCQSSQPHPLPSTPILLLLAFLAPHHFPKPGLAFSVSWLNPKRSKFQLTHFEETFALHPLGLRQFLFFHGYKHEIGFAESDVTHLNDQRILRLLVSPVVSSMLVFLTNILWLLGKVGCQQVVTMIVFYKRCWSGSGG